MWQLKNLSDLKRFRRQAKYHNVHTDIETKYGILKFQSKKEAEYYQSVKLLNPVLILRQVPFDLPGGIKYRADFLIIYRDGSFDIVDVKGYETQIFKMKRRQVEELYNIRIHVV